MCDVGIGERASVFYANMIGDDPTNMSLDLLKQTLDGAMGFRPLPKVGLAFTEPLLHKRIVEICDRIVRAGYYCQLTTNGTVHSDAVVHALARHAGVIHLSADRPDFLDAYVGTYHWPAFNVADMAISIGVVVLCIDALRGAPEAERSPT